MSLHTLEPLPGVVLPNICTVALTPKKIACHPL